MKRMGEIVQHGERWIITDEGRALQTIDGLRTAMDHAIGGNLFDAESRLSWLRAWREGDKRREAFENKSGSETSTKSP
jgi:hypothetical protein